MKRLKFWKETMKRLKVWKEFPRELPKIQWSFEVSSCNIPMTKKYTLAHTCIHVHIYK